MINLPEVITVNQQYQPILQVMACADTNSVSFDADIGGVTHHFSNGGLHGALKNARFDETTEQKIIDIDFSSCYAYIMLLYVPWFWSKMSREQFKRLVVERISAKRNGEESKAAELKKIIAPAYGLASKENKTGGNSICAIGQLLLLDLLDKVTQLEGIKLINTCTDGVILAYPAAIETELIATVEAVKNRLRMPLEYTELHHIYQQDVHTYVAEIGKTYTVRNGENVVQEEDSHKLKVKGQTMSPIVREAVARHILGSTPIESTINSCQDIKSFALKIVRLQQTVAGNRWNVNNKWLVVPDSVDVYATKRAEFGIVGKLDYAGKFTRYPATAFHSLCDINGNMDFSLLDKEFYLEEAYRYINQWNKKIYNNERGKAHV